MVIIIVIVISILTVGARGSPQRINESPWAGCLQGAVDARWVVVVVVVVVIVVVLLLLLWLCCCRRRPRGGHMD